MLDLREENKCMKEQMETKIVILYHKYFLIDCSIRFTVIYSYPGGDNNDKRTHLSLYICIKQGEFDIICIGPSRTIWNWNWWMILWSSLNCYRFLPCVEGTKFGSRPYHKSNLKYPDVIFEMSFTMIFWCTCPCKF